MKPNNSKKRGFASFTPERHREVSSRGGKAKVSKGFASLDPSQRSEVARRGAQSRWNKRLLEEGKPINSQEDGRVREDKDHIAESVDQ